MHEIIEMDGIRKPNLDRVINDRILYESNRLSGIKWYWVIKLRVYEKNSKIKTSFVTLRGRISRITKLVLILLFNFNIRGRLSNTMLFMIYQ